MSELLPREAAARCHELRTAADDLAAFDRRELLWMLFLMEVIRAFETAVLDLKEADLVHGPAHTSIGQEAVAAGVALALRKSDHVGSTHRAHGHFLAKALVAYAPDDWHPLEHTLTDDMQRAVDRTLAEIMGLRDGWCGGRGGSMHLYDARSGNLGSNAIVGGGIPLATGYAWAERLQGRDAVVVSIFGDGAVNQGCLHEAANMAALWSVPVIYLVENNLYAVGTRADQASYVADLALRALGWGIDSLIVDGMNPLAVALAVGRAAEAMCRRPFPAFIEAKTYRHVHHAGRLVGSAFGYRSKQEEAEWLALDPLATFPRLLGEQGLLAEKEGQRLRDLGAAAVRHALDACTDERDGARVIPAATWPLAESLARDVRAEEALVGVTFREEEACPGPWRAATYVEAVAAVIRHALESDERVVVLGEEVANLRGGAFGATRGAAETAPDRVLNTPISETGFVGIAGGAAAAGLRPVVEIMYPDFCLMASDQLFNQIGKLRHMYGGQIAFPLVVRTRVGMGFGYGGQHSMEPSAFFGQFPGWRVMAPATPYDYVGLFNTALRYDDPVLIVEHGLLYDSEGRIPADSLDYYLPYGAAKVRREGSDVTVLTYATGVRDCLAAADALAAEGIEAEVIDLRTLDDQGMDLATIGRSLRTTGAVAIVEHCPRSQGIGGRLADAIQARFFDYLDGPIGRVHAPDAPSPVSRALERAFLPTREAIHSLVGRVARRRL